jgi:hypothetical protein
MAVLLVSFTKIDTKDQLDCHTVSPKSTSAKLTRLMFALLLISLGLWTGLLKLLPALMNVQFTP